MDRKTALSAAGALTLTAVAAVSALFVTMDAGADAGNEPTAPVVAQPEVVTEYEVVAVEPTSPESAPDVDAVSMEGEPEDHPEGHGPEDHPEGEEPEGDDHEHDEYPEDDEDEDDD